jgi:hypothetical protein
VPFGDSDFAEWTLRESGLGAAKLSRYGKDSNLLIVLTAEAPPALPGWGCPLGRHQKGPATVLSDASG